MSMKSDAATRAIETQSRGTVSDSASKLAATSKNKPVGAEPKKRATSKSMRDAKRRPRSPRTDSKAERLVCRNCGSDDLAPSFKKRRDARCRACFKKRYGSSARNTKVGRTRTAKSAK